MAIGFKGQVLTGVGYKGTVYTGVGYKGVDYSPVATPPPAMTFFDALIARADVLTASEFITITGTDQTRYRQYPNSTNIGTIVNEYAAAGVPANTPIIRGVRSTSNSHLEFRSLNGDLTSRGGINYTAFNGWGAWAPMDNASLDHGIYFIDVANQEWFAIAPNRRTSRSGTGSWANWSNGIDNASWATSFPGITAANTYWAAFLSATTPRTIITAVLNNHDYVPVFP